MRTTSSADGSRPSSTRSAVLRAISSTCALVCADVAEPAVFVHRGAGRDRVGLAALGLHVLDRLLPALADPDVESIVDQLDVGAHDAAEHDVADAVVDGVLVGNPALLYEAALHSDFCRDRGDHARVVGLDAADRDQRVGVGGDGVRNDVLELAQLVAAVGQARVAVLAFGVELDAAAEMRGQALELLDVSRSERQRIALEFLQHDEALRCSGSDDAILSLISWVRSGPIRRLTT